MRSESFNQLLLLNHLGWVHTIIYLTLINTVIGIGLYRYWKVFHATTNFHAYQPIQDSMPRTTNPVGFGSILYTVGLGIVLIFAELSVIAVDAVLYSTWLSTSYTISLLLELFLLGSIVGYFALELEVLGTISHAWAGYWVGFLVAPTQGLMAWRWARVILSGKITTLDSFEGFICFLFFMRLLSNSVFSRHCLNWLQLNNYSWKFNQLSIYQDLESAEAQDPSKKTGLSELYYRVKKVFKFMWPENDKHLQRLIYLSYVLMISNILVSASTPQVNKWVIDTLGFPTNADGSKVPQTQIWYLVIFFFGLKLFQGTNGLLKSAQSYVLIPINQHTQRYLSTHTFSHVHHLSLDFHIKKKSGELVKIIDRGVQSIGFLNNYIVFQLFPIFLEIGVSAIAVFITMNYIYSIILSFTMLFYAWATIVITEWRTKFRKGMIEKENQISSIIIDSLTNFETVKYFNGEKYELERLRKATIAYQKDEFKTNVSLSFLNLAQNFILVTGQLIGSLLVVYQISRKQAGVGDFVMFQAYFLNLAAPLNFFGTFYRIIQQSSIDMDKLVSLLDQKPSVKEDPSSASLIPGPGEIVFDNVTFGYQPGVPTLKNVSFKALPGQKIALVGPTGSGKSSILRCLLRFYDIESGAIYVNGQDISKITLSSLRKAIGVVPQDMVLFNDTIKYNILYGDPEASFEQMEDAAKRSKIHDKILSFPEGYSTMVGERGLRLSGGEKQRVAIARTILKNPSIVLLDEATSALDVTTEKEIQSSLHSVTTGRTSISVAHRLTTIMNSDMILYIQDGNVMEQGTHEELLSKEDGFYKTMWFRQLEEQSNVRTKLPIKI